MNTENKFTEKLIAVRNEIVAAIKNLLSERKIESINCYAYWSERNCDRYLFYDVDDDGYGIALYVDKIRTDEKGDLCFEMMDLNDTPISDWDLTMFDASNTNYLYDMILSIIEEADEEDNGRVLTADEEFDDWEDEE